MNREDIFKFLFLNFYVIFDIHVLRLRLRKAMLRFSKIKYPVTELRPKRRDSHFPGPMKNCHSCNYQLMISIKWDQQQVTCI